MCKMIALIHYGSIKFVHIHSINIFFISDCVLCHNTIQFAQGSGLQQKNNVVYIGKYQVTVLR